MKKITLFLVICLILTCFGNVFTGVAFADTASRYTDVLEDLQKDETFNAAQYPASDKDTMDVIQIAESSAGELFLYVYSTTGDKFTASEARISTSIGENLEPKDYKLTLLSRNGTLSKYIVNGLTVKPDTVRYYVVTQLARPWDKDVDKEPPVNTANTVPYPIGKQFTACTVDGNVTYTEAREDVVTIVDKYVGNIMYLKGTPLFEPCSKDYTSSHYVAFSTDRQIDQLFEASLTYVSVGYAGDLNLVGVVNTPSVSRETKNLTLYSNEKGSSNGILFYPSYTWERIQTVDTFVSQNDSLKDEVKETLKNKQWVLRFAETRIHDQLVGTDTWYEVSEVTILRLKFKTENNIFNLGVVDNEQTGDSVTDPDNTDTSLDVIGQMQAAMKRVTDFFNSVADWFVKAGQWLAKNWWVIIVGVVVIAIVISLFFQVGRQVVGAIFIGIGKALWWFVKYLGIGLFYVITSPYWIIRAIVLAAKRRKNE